MPIEEIIGGKLFGLLVDQSVAFLKKSRDSQESHIEKARDDISLGWSNQVKRAMKFSQNLEAFRFEDTREIAENTIDLSISKTTRQSFNSIDDNRKTNELEIVLAPESQLILGDPGAGKTTTIKRMIALCFEQLFDSDDVNYPYSFPIIVKMGEIPRTDGLFTHLCKQIGVAYETVEKNVDYEATEIVRVDAPNGDGHLDEEITTTKTKKVTEYKIGNLALDVALAEFIDSHKIILFLDGLDEVNFEIRDRAFAEIRKLSSNIASAKIIASSRYFDESTSFRSFKKNEILPLSEDERIRIVSQWTARPDEFLGKLSSKPYKDVASRPLFLFYLLMLYRSNHAELPEQGIDVYRQVVLLVLREWDHDKEHITERYSKFKRFDTYKREDFISEIAFQLTYEMGVKKIFSAEDLKKSFVRIYGKYPQLEYADAEDVIKDIETHNGLIITSYTNQFEFSHLSLQEYLCAKHILGIPFSRKIFDYFSANPEPLALAVILSPQPAEWFANLVISNLNEQQNSRKFSHQTILVFVNRLVIEGVIFEAASVELGMAIISLLFKGNMNSAVVHAIGKLLSIRNASDSVRLALPRFKVIERNSDHVEIECLKNITSDLYLSFPEKGIIPRYLWNELR